MKHSLVIHASMRRDGSETRAITERVLEQLDLSPEQMVERDLADGVEIIDQDWIGANFTPADQRSEAQLKRLANSDSLVEELEAADILVIGLPIYNFGVPGAFKLWIDLVARVGRTFKYGETGPIGLLKNKQAYIVIASGGTILGSEIDFVSAWLRHTLGFIGIEQIVIVDATGSGRDKKVVEDKVDSQLESIKPV
ncbi:MAG: NAD(P)H-dependent oxidoreductase [Pseudomonadota bacterium]